ncbi:Zn-dependent hydrolase [Salipaludibacillus agaradhaerens]|uniref:Zn-dependent hydrolase n=1 Tax=Salipaludibacillus agaradhaerens TaxID=76935 RepID=UPI0021516087|nr:Zn-dependent hydrolase [Salipaludibacillus agaradhaerens]MCR6105507.1 Zn-dependent hydrolase [Salipaludibacillus agaradhaerens]MCR6117545.1 Zn-dependent hydrolase [Salipaludibacillus agaradhaerens]
MVITSNINSDRLWRTLMELGKIGASCEEGEGVTRLSLSREELEAKHYIYQLMKEIGLDAHMDAVGNVIGKLQGSEPQAPVVMVGSHTDTVFHGGRFDGALGVLGAIEAVRTIKEANIPLTHAIEIVSFTDEEGSRFGTGYIGSKAMAGMLKETIFDLKDKDGVSYRQAFIDAEFNPENYKDVIRQPGDIKAYIEMHIEQAKVLEELDLPIGIVTDIQGPVWLDVTLEGATDHAGATPMTMRKDVAVGVAEIVLAVENVALTYHGVGTVGIIKLEPGAVNVIPGRTLFSIDVRHSDKGVRQQMVNDIYKKIEAVCKKRRLTSRIDVKKEVDPAVCSPKIVTLLEETCHGLRYPVKKLPCGAGHDSLIMSKVTDIGMIFVRSKGGISHNPKEWSSQSDCAIGTELLFHTLVKLAQ